MTAFALDAPNYPSRNRSRERRTFFSKWAIGATGAVGAQVTDDSGITLTRTGVGTYNLTYPAGAEVFIDFQLQAADATPTAASFVTTAESPSAGTATFIAVNGTAAAEIESGSTLKLSIDVFGVTPGT